MKDLVRKAKEGNKQAFSELLEIHKLKLYKTAKAILKDEDDVCDAIQETLLSSYKSISQLKNEDYFTTWLIRILINKCYDILNSKKVIAFSIEYDKIQIEDTTNQFDEKRIDVMQALNKIDDDLRELAILYYYDELSVKEISEILNIKEGTVKSRLSRAREQLYNVLNVGGEKYA